MKKITAEQKELLKKYLILTHPLDEETKYYITLRDNLEAKSLADTYDEVEDKDLCLKLIEGYEALDTIGEGDEDITVKGEYCYSRSRCVSNPWLAEVKVNVFNGQ